MCPGETESTCFNQAINISSLNCKPLKLVDQVIYLGSNISSTESELNKRLVIASITANRWSIIGKSDLSDKIKREFFQVVAK